MVPRLTHLTLSGARQALAHADCALGRVTRPKRTRHALVLRVSRQSVRPGARDRSGYEVNLTMRY